MRTPATAFAALALAGCATTSEPTPPYDEVAQLLGAGVTGERAALANVSRIAHGGIPDDTTVSYDVRCFDAIGKRITCGESTVTVTATATAVWGGHDYLQDATWILRGIDDELGLVTTESWAVFGDTLTRKEGTLLYDLGELRAKGGSEDAVVLLDELTVDAQIRYERWPLVTITVDDRAYWLDENGTVTLATQLE